MESRQRFVRKLDGVYRLVYRKSAALIWNTWKNNPFRIPVILVLILLTMTGSAGILFTPNTPLKQTTPQAAKAKTYMYSPSSVNLVTGSERQVDSGSASNINAGWKSTISGQNDAWWYVDSVTPSTPNLDVQINIAGVQLQNANILMFENRLFVGNASLAIRLQICDWVSSTSVDAAADAQCTGGGWRTINTRDASNNSVDNGPTSVDSVFHRLFDGYFATGTTGGTPISTPLTNFVNTSSNNTLKIRYWSDADISSYLAIDSLVAIAQVDPVYEAASFTQITGGTPSGSYVNTYVRGNTTTGSLSVTASDAIRLQVPGTAGAISDFYMSYKNVQTYTGANTIYVRSDYSCSTTGINIKPKIFNFNSNLWEDLTSGTIACSTSDANSAWAKNNVTISNYISSGEIRVGWYGSANNTLNIRIDLMFVMIGTTNTDSSLCEITFGTGTATNCTNTRDLDVTGTTNTFSNPSVDESNTYGNDFYPYDNDADATTGEATAANISFSVTLPSDAQITNAQYAQRYAAGTSGAPTTMVVQGGLRDYSALTYAAGNLFKGGWIDYGSSSNSATQTISDGVSYNNRSYYASYLDSAGANVSSDYFVDTVNNQMNMRLRTSTSGNTANNATTEWDFAMVSISWVQDSSHPTKSFGFTPTSKTLAVGTETNRLAATAPNTSGGVNSGGWQSAMAPDGIQWVIAGANLGGGAVNYDAQLNLKNVQLNGANAMTIMTTVVTNANIGLTFQICDWVSTTSVDVAADANCTGGGWRSLNTQNASNADVTFTSTSATTGTAFRWDVYDGYFTTGTTGGSAVSTPLGNFVHATNGVKIRFYSGTQSASNMGMDFVRIVPTVNPVYQASGFTQITGGTVAGTYVNTVAIGNTASGSLNSSSSDSNRLQVPGTTAGSGSISDFYLSYKNVKYFSDANTILVRAEYSCDNTGINHKPKIYNFSSAAWEDLTTSAIACSTTDTNGMWSKNNVTLSDYIAGGEVRVGWYGSANSTINIRLDLLYIVIGSVNTDSSQCEITFGTGTATDCTNTRSVDTTGTTATFNNPAEDESTTMGIGAEYSYYGMDNDQNATLGEATSANITFPVSQLANTAVVGFNWATRYQGCGYTGNACGATALTVLDGLRYHNTRTDGVVNGGWTTLNNTSSTSMTYRDSTVDNSSNRFPMPNPRSIAQNMFNSSGNTMNIRLRTSVAGTAASNVTTSWDFAMASLTWIEIGSSISVAGSSSVDAATVVIAVDGALVVGANATVASSAWTISSVWVRNGAPVTVWHDGASDANESTGFTIYDGSGNITGMVLTAHTLSVGSADNQSGSPPDMAKYDNRADEDVMHKYTSSTLAVDATSSYSDEIIDILSGDTLSVAATETLTTNDLTINGTLTSGGATAYTVGGSWANNGTFTASTSTVTMGATAGSKTLTGTMTGSTGKFYNLVFNGVGGGWSFATNSAEIANNLTITNGTVTAPSTTLTIVGNYSNASVFTHNSGTVAFSATATGKTLSGTLSGTNGKFYNLTFTTTDATSTDDWEIQAAIETVNDFTITSGNTDSNNNNATIGRDFTITNASNTDYDAGTATLTVARHFVDTGNLFTESSSELKMTGTGDLNSAGDLYKFTVTGTVTKTSSNTLLVSNTLDIQLGGNLSTGTSCGSIQHTGGSGTNLTIAGTLSGSCNFWQLSSNEPTVSITGTVSFAATTVEFVWQYSGAATYTIPAYTTNGYITFYPVTNDVTYNIGSGTMSAGGFLFKHNTAGKTLTIDNTVNNSAMTTTVRDFEFTSIAGSTAFLMGSATYTVKRHWNNADTAVITAGTSTVNFDGGGTVTSAGQSFYNIITTSGTVTVGDALSATNDLTMTGGTLDGTQNVTVNGHVAGTAGTINLTGGTFEQRVATDKNFGTTSGSTAWTFSSLTFSNSGVASRTITTQTGGTGGITVSGVLTLGQVADSWITNFNAGNRTWTLSGTGGDPYQVTINGLLLSSTSTFSFSGNNGGGNTNIEDTGAYYNLTINNGSETYTLEGTTTVNNNLAISAGTLDVTGSNFGLTVKGNYTNSGSFTANSGTVTLSGTSTQTLSGGMLTTNAFYNLTITNSSGTNASDCELTDWVAGIDFAASATVTNNLVMTTASTRVEFNNGSTYTFNNINWNGQAVGTRIYFRNSAASGSWNLAVSGTQTAVSYLNVSRSDASGGNTINANDGNSTDCGNNVNWEFGKTVSGVVYLTNESTIATTGNGGPCDGATAIVAARVNGGTASTATCSASTAAYSVYLSTTPTAGQTITVYLTATLTTKGNTVTLSDGSSNTGVDIYIDHVIVRHENAGPMTNTAMNQYDTDQNPTDMLFTVVTAGPASNLSVTAGKELHVTSSKTFTPGGTVTTGLAGDVHIVGTLSMGGNALSIGGSYNNAGTFTSASNTTTFTSTASGKTLAGTMTGSSAFYNLTFNGVSGAWTFNAAVAVTNDYTGTNGSVTASGNNLTVTRDLTLANTAGVDYVAGSSTITVGNDFNDTGNKFTEGTSSTVDMTGTADNAGTLNSTSYMYNLQVGGSGKTITIGSSMNQVNGIMTLNGGSVAGSAWLNLAGTTSKTPLVFAAATTLTGSQYLTYRITGGTNVTFTIAGGNYGSWHIDVYTSSTNDSIYNLAGDVTTTDRMMLIADTAVTGTTFNTQNFAVTASYIQFGDGTAGRDGGVTANLGSSTVALSSTSNSLSPASANNGTGHVLNMQTSSVTVSGGVLFVNGTGAITVTPGTSTLTWIHTSGTATYAPNSQSLYNVVLNGSGGTVSPSGTVSITNDLTITLGTFDTTTSNYAVNVTRDLTIAGSASAVFRARTSTVTVSRHWSMDTNGVFTRDSSTVQLTGTGNIAGTGTTQFENLSIGYSAKITTLAAGTARTDVFGILTLNGGTVTASGTYSFMLIKSSAGTYTPLVFASPTTLTGTNTQLNFRATVTGITINIPAGNYGSWVIYTYASAGNSNTWQLSGDVTTTGDFNIFATSGVTGTIFNTQNYAITSKTFLFGQSAQTATVAASFGSSTLTFSNTTATAFGVNSNSGSHTLDMGSSAITVTGSVYFAQGTGAITITPGTSTLTWVNTSGTLTYAPNGQSLYNLTLNGSGSTVTPNGAVIVTNDLTMTAGTLNGTQNITVNGNVAGTAGIISLTGGTFKQRAGSSKNFGTTSGSTAWTFSSLTFSTSAAGAPCPTIIYTTQTGGSGGITVSGVLLVGESGDSCSTNLNAGNRTWTLSGTSGDPFQLLASPAGTLTASTSTFKYTNLNPASGLTTIEKTSSGYNNLELNDGLIGYWRLNDGSGTTATDDSGNSNTGNLGAGAAQPTWSSTVYNSTYYGGDSGSLDFDGGDYVTVPYSSALTPSTGVTVSAWVKFDSVTSGRKIVSKTESGGWQLGINETSGNCTASQLCFLINIGGAYRKAEWPTSNLTTGTWYHIVGTYSGTAVKLYVNNSNVATTNITGSITYNNSNPVCIGSEAGASACNSGDYLDGIINDVRIYDRGIGATEISDIYGGGSATYATFQLEGNTTIGGNLGLRSGKLDAISGSNYNISVGGNYSNFGYYLPQSNTTSFTATSTGKTLTGVLSGTYGAFYNLTFNGSGGEWTPSAAVAVSNDLTMTAGTLLGTQNLTVSGGDITGDGTINLTGGTTTLTADGNFGGATAWTFYTLKFGNTSTLVPVETVTATGAGGITVADVLTINSHSGLGCAMNTLNAGSKTWTLSGTTGAPLVVNGTLTPSTSTITFTGNNGSGNTSVPGSGAACGDATYYNLTVNNGSETYAVGGTTNLTVNNNLTITAGTFTAGSGTTTIGNNYSNSGTFTANSGTVTFNATDASNTLGGTMTGSSAFYNLTFSGISGAWSFGANAAEVANNFTITNGTVTAPSTTLTITGNYSNSGTFTANSGTVTLNGSSTQTISGNLTGSSSFYDLTISNASGTIASDCERTDWVAGVDFNAAATVTNNYTITTASVKVEYNNGSTYTINNMNWNGQAVGTRLYFRNSSANDGDAWYLNVTAVGNAQTKVSYINVSRSNASGGATIIASDGTNTDCGNNVNWQFDETLTLGLDSTSKDFGVINPGSNPSNQVTTLTATSNAVNGYVIYAWSTQAMTNVRFGGVTIDDWTGTNATPTAFSPGSYGFGYSTNDLSLTGGTSDRFDPGGGGSPRYAGFTHTGPGDPVADRTAPATGATNTINYRLYPSTTQADGDYSTIIVYVIAAQFP